MKYKVLILIITLILVCVKISFADSYYDRRVSLFEILPISQTDIVFLGNSITDGGEFNELFNNSNIKNRGITSDVIKGVEKRLNQVTKGQPQKIFLLIGINDVSHHLSPDTIANDYARLVDKIIENSPSTKLYIQSIMPINNDFKRYKNLLGKENVITEVNEKLKRIAIQRGLTYIDLTPILAEPNSGKLKKQFTNDGLHLSGPGYKAWTDAIREYVEE